MLRNRSELIFKYLDIIFFNSTGNNQYYIVNLVAGNKFYKIIKNKEKILSLI